MGCSHLSRTKLNQRMVPISTFFGLAVWIIQDGKSPGVQSDPFFPEWKPALNVKLPITLVF